MGVVGALLCQETNQISAGLCRECMAPLPFVMRHYTGPRTKGVMAPDKMYKSAEEAAKAHNVSSNYVRRLCRLGGDWCWAPTKHDSVETLVSVRRKFCGAKCRNSWHSRHRDYEPKNSRVEFALHVLRFMEKTYGPQTEKMRTAWQSKRSER